jgi:hypothetical protein
MQDNVPKLIQELKRLRLQEARIIERIEAAAAASRTREVYEQRDDYQVGDRVYINNRIRRPLQAAATWTAELERKATVTDVKGDRFFLTTDNGTKTWREVAGLRLFVKHE